MTLGNMFKASVCADTERVVPISQMRKLRPQRFLVFLRYQCYYEYPLLTYLEYPILVAQDLILLLCVFHFKGDVKQAAPYIVLCVSAWFILTLQKWIIDLAMNLCTFISAASKFAQLQYLWKSRDSGAVSAATWSLASYTCAARIMTTLMTTSDLTILIRFVIMLALNTWVAATILHYQTDVKSE
ncbi:solute carrier family 66 member 3 isoform X2 [Phocoena sinus]|uniref:solute carrier family 66 member 3 isoform X2 n=1 Tax=Phocoena sinus TaxID=42100 RepID=UPI0013C4353C|nr:solute carrier family 66 member 3 isoform X2 [Phocoena sinus]